MDVRCGENGSAPVGRCGRVKGACIGADGSSSFSSGDIIGEDKVIVIKRPT
jgi:hypothetical protein